MTVPALEGQPDISRPNTAPTWPIVSPATSPSTRAAPPRRRRSPEVVIDHLHLGGGPTQATARPASPYCAASTRCDRRPAGAKIAGRTWAASRSRCQPWILPSPRSCRSIALTPGPLRRRLGRDRQPLQEHARSNPRMSFRVASGNDVHSSVSGTFVSAVIWGGCPRRLSFPPGSRARSSPAHSTSRSRPSLPITGVLTPACPTIHALRQTD